MSVVRGRVVGATSGVGLANLLVEAFDVDERSEGGPSARSAYRRRLGSTETSPQGDFKIEYGGKDLGDAARSVEAVNLLLTVSVPERPDQGAKVLYASRDTRRNAGAVEVYLVRIDDDALEKAGGTIPVTAPGNAEPAALASARLLADSRRSVDLSRAQVEALRLRVDEARTVQASFQDELKTSIEQSLSSVSPAARASELFVPPTASVNDVYRKVVDLDLSRTINDASKRAPLRTRISLTDAQLADLRAGADANGTIGGETVRRVLGKAGPAGHTSVERVDLEALTCRELSRRERSCADALGVPLPPEPAAPTGGGTGGNVTGSGVEDIGTDDVRRYLARLVDTVTSPEEGVLAGLEPRATRDVLDARMQELSFRPSPADTPALYEFHNLQVAFRYVWQEAIDEGVLSLAESAYDEIVAGGGRPRPTPGTHPIKVMLREARAVARARGPSQPDASASARFPFNTGLLGGMLTPDRFVDAGTVEALPSLVAELTQRLQEPYAFTTFAANRQERSINFGVRVTYQQKWTPLEYQAGRLAKTITLAPKEVRRYTKTVKRHKKRADKEIEKHISIRKDETSQTSRVEQEVIRKANAKTHFEMGREPASGPVEGTPSPTNKFSFERDVSQASESTKRSFNESVKKAAQELTNELTVEVNREESEDVEETESGEISNPNDELAVTFLFYELQRRYRISERLYRVTPVVFVAQEMPKPHEINEAWLVSHDWILRRVLLDDSFAPALTYLSSQVVGDEIALGEMRTNIAQERAVVADLKTQLTVVRQRVASYRSLLEQSLLHAAGKKKSGGGLLSGIPIVGGAIDLAEDVLDAAGDFIHPDMPDTGTSREDALKETIQRTVDEERDLVMRLEREVTALNALTETYAKALADNYNQRTQILRLRTHVKQNILYYMQAIWNHEPPDQRFLRLHETPVPVFGGNTSYRLTSPTAPAGSMASLPHRRLTGTKVYELEMFCDLGARATQPLSRVADLDNLLGYFGNYMIFPLKESNALTDFMMEPYLLQGFDEIADPDDLGNWSLDEFVDYVLCLQKKLEAGEFDQLRPELRAMYDRLMTAPRRQGDVISVPTGSLFIEALPATSSLIERYKAIHRAVDVKKAQAEARHAEINNLRLVDRLLHGEREDPEIDKKVFIQGNASPVVPVDP